MKRSGKRFVLLVSLVLLGVSFALAQNRDRAGSKDHPLISRYPGSYINEYVQKEYDEFTLPLGQLSDRTRNAEKSQHLEGKVTRIRYQCSKERSTLEVFRNYESALRNAGFETLFTCVKAECGNTQGARLYGGSVDNWGPFYGLRYLAGKLSRPEGEAYVSLGVADSNDGPRVSLYVIEMKPLEAGLVTVNAASLAADITRTGHASVYGVYFDTGKAEIKPESDATLKEIAKLLTQDPKLKLHVVGHTDNQGALEMNMDLSRRRADSVVKALTTKYGVAAVRLHALGDGPSAPVASNDTEDGRAKNRRVELVKQ
jgi:flagellar motor protein MotB